MYQSKQLDDLVNENTTSIGLMEIEIDFLNEKLNDLTEESSKKTDEKSKDSDYEKDNNTEKDYKEKLENLYDEKNRDYLKFIFQYKDELFPELKRLKDNQKQLLEKKKQLLEIEELSHQHKINNYKIETLLSKINEIPKLIIDISVC